MVSQILKAMKIHLVSAGESHSERIMESLESYAVSCLTV